MSFERIVCGIDPSPVSLEAVRQASELSSQGVRMVGVGVWDPALTAHTGLAATRLAEQLQRESHEALEGARRAFPTLDLRLVRGRAIPTLLGVTEEENAELVAVGSHGGSRVAGMALGSVATAIAHYAPCSVLIARQSDRPFPARIVYATDGSSDSRAAATVVGQIAARHGSTVISIHVSGEPERSRALAEESVGLLGATGQEPIVKVEEGSPHSRVPEFAAEAHAALVVVGSRGLTGVRGLGSVSERVAHRSPCSVLIVRPRETSGS